jgi:hypothetical protein
VPAAVIPVHDEDAMRWFLKAASEAPGGAVSYLFRIPHVYIAGNCTRGAVAVVHRVVVGPGVALDIERQSVYNPRAPE